MVIEIVRMETDSEDAREHDSIVIGPFESNLPACQRRLFALSSIA